MRTPVVGVTPQVRDDKVNVGVLRRQHVNNLRPADHIDKDGQPKRSRGFADLARRHGFEAMDLDAAETPLADRVRDHGKNPSGVARGVDEHKSDQAGWVAGDDVRELCICPVVIAMKSGDYDRLVNARGTGTAEV